MKQDLRYSIQELWKQYLHEKEYNVQNIGIKILSLYKMLYKTRMYDTWYSIQDTLDRMQDYNPGYRIHCKITGSRIETKCKTGV